MWRKGGLILAALLGQIAVTSGQVASPQPLPREPLEKYDNWPAFLRAPTVTSPAVVSRFGYFTSYQVNVDSNGNDVAGDAANEPSICVHATNPNKMSIGWRQFNSISSNFRQAGFAYTTNGGRNWTAPGVLENNVFRSDPVLKTDGTGRFYYLSLLQTFFDNMWRSLDGGQSWTNIAQADGGDKQWFTIDNTNSTGHGFQYQCWSTSGNNYQGRQFTRSMDGGFTWMDPINIPNSPAWGTLDVDSNGSLFVGGVNLTTNQIWCIRSTNAKNGAVTPTFDQSTAVDLGGTIAFSQPINPEGLVGQVFLAVDRSGTVSNNNIYMLASVRATDANNGSDVMFARSTNGGQSFTGGRRISDDPVNPAKWHWFGTVAVAPNGRIDAVWFDTRNASNNTNSQLFYSFSSDGGLTWSPNVAVSVPFNPFLSYPNQNKIGDYITIVSDNTGGNVAYAATFNGEEEIYYVRVSPDLARATLPTDLNQDGRPDYLLYNSGTRQSAIWYLNNNVLVRGAYGPTIAAGWSIVAVTDFDRDGHPDYLLYNSGTRQSAIWYLNNNVLVRAVYGPTIAAGWSVVAAADFDGDGKPDLLLFNTGTQQTAIWFLNNNLFLRGSYGPTLPSGWSVVGAADFNRDGKSDFVLFNSSTRQSAIWYMSGATRISAAYGPTIASGFVLHGAADFNSDLSPDLLLVNPNTRETTILYLSGAILLSSASGPTLPSVWTLIAP
jgi:hypothetical protein